MLLRITCCLPWCQCSKSKSLLHFCKFLPNANIDVIAAYLFKHCMKWRFWWYIVHMETLSTFHTQLNMFILYQYTQKRHPNQWTRKPPQTSLPLGMWTPSNTPMPGPTPLTTKWQLDRFMHLYTTMQLSPHWLQWDFLYPPQNCLCRGAITNLNYLPHPWTQLIYHPKWHPEPESHFYTIHQTDQQTEGRTNWQIGHAASCISIPAYALYDVMMRLIIIIKV